MRGPLQAVKASRNRNAKGKTQNYYVYMYLIHNFPTGVSASAQRQSQRCGWNLRVPFLTAMLLMTFEERARATAA